MVGSVYSVYVLTTGGQVNTRFLTSLVLVCYVFYTTARNTQLLRDYPFVTSARLGALGQYFILGKQHDSTLCWHKGVFAPECVPVQRTQSRT